MLPRAPERGAGGIKIRRLAVQNCDGFCDPTRTLYPKAPAKADPSRSEFGLPLSLLFFCSSSTNTGSGRPNYRQRIAPRLPDSLTHGALSLATDPQTAPPLREGAQSFVHVAATAHAAGREQRKPREQAPPLADTC